jgi:uncharacterized membrane protein
MTLLDLNLFYALCGLVLLAVAVLIVLNPAHPRRFGSTVFWALLALAIGAGPWLPAAMVGYAVLAATLLVATRQVGVPEFAGPSAEERQAKAEQLGNRLLWPILLVPAVAVVGSFTLERVTWADFRLVDPKQAAQAALALGCVAGLLWAARVTRERPRVVAAEGGRLLELLGWTLVLPQMLAALGGIFAKAGVGEVIAGLVAGALPVQDPLVAVVAYCAGMALFTILLGNAFAAFPVMTLGVGLPFVVRAHGGDPAVLGAVGMLCGYCGTLVTPMAANFNLVPVKLLELRGDYAVIRAQAPFAAAIWIFNVVLMYLCVYPH